MKKDDNLVIEDDILTAKPRRSKVMEMNEPNNKPNVEQIVKEHRPRLKSFIRNRVSNNEDAEDILQDVFYQLIKTVENNVSPIEQVSAWLYRVAKNTIINKGKKKREESLSTPGYDEEGNVMEEFSEILFNDDNPTPETEYIRSLVWKELEAALAELPPEQSEIFELTELEGLPVKEIAAAMNVPVNTLLSRKHYAVKHLRKRLLVLYRELMQY